MTSSDLLRRSAVAAALVAVAGLALWIGGLAFWLLTAVLALVALGEWAALTGATRSTVRLAQFAASVPLALMAPGLGAGPGFLTLGLTAGAGFFVVIVTRGRALAAGTVYLTVAVLALLLILAQGRLFTLWAIALVSICDIGAYTAGRSIGGPRLAPTISPNKTWSGLIGGVVAAGIFGAALHLAVGLPWRLTLASAPLALVAQAGDLLESWLKRRAGVKDSGTLLPGHGGVLDRVDGLLPVAPLAALLVLLPRLIH